MVITGTVTFTIGDETRSSGPGARGGSRPNAAPGQRRAGRGGRHRHLRADARRLGCPPVPTRRARLAWPANRLRAPRPSRRRVRPVGRHRTSSARRFARRSAARSRPPRPPPSAVAAQIRPPRRSTMRGRAPGRSPGRWRRRAPPRTGRTARTDGSPSASSKPIPRSRTVDAAISSPTATSDLDRRCRRAVLDGVAEEVLEDQGEQRLVGLDDGARRSLVSTTDVASRVPRPERDDSALDDPVEDLRLQLRPRARPEPGQLEQVLDDRRGAGRHRSRCRRSSPPASRRSGRRRAPGAAGRCRRSSSPASAARARRGRGTGP